MGAMFLRVEKNKQTALLMCGNQKAFPCEYTREWKRCTEPVRFDTCTHGPAISMCGNRKTERGGVSRGREIFQQKNTCDRKRTRVSRLPPSNYSIELENRK